MYCDTNEERAREEWNKMLPPHPLNRFAYYLNIIPLFKYIYFTYLYTKIGFYKYKSIRFSLTILNLSIRVYKDEKANVIKITF